MPQISVNPFVPNDSEPYGKTQPFYKSFNAPIEWAQRYYPLMLNHTKRWFKNRLDPFKLCPITIFFWFMIPPYSAIGIKLSDLNRISIFARQQIEPNETLYLLFEITQFKLPFTLMLLIMFSSLGLVITDAANRLLQAFRLEFENLVQKTSAELEELSTREFDLDHEIQTAVDQENHAARVKALDPFQLTPRLSIYYPILDDHVELGFLTIDFRHVEISLKQKLEPNGTVISLIRFLDLYTPFPLQIMVMSLSLGLFVANSIYKYEKTSREEILTQFKNSLKTNLQR